MTACICPPPVQEHGRTVLIRVDDCPTHGEEARCGWDEGEV